MTADNTVVVRYLCEVFVYHHLVVHHRTYLEKVELSCLVGLELYCKFYLNRASHLILSVFQNHLQNLR